jgi:alpha-beta hydrolase superfamily lysophospholipase
MSSRDDTGIGYRHWAAAAPRAVFLLVHGLGAHGGRWEACGDYFMRRGISSYAVELRDLDRPDEHDPRTQNFRSYDERILRLHAIAGSGNPGKKIFLVGESMGGLIAFLLAAQRPGLFNGLICISPAFANRLKLPVRTYLSIFLSLIFDPGRTFSLPFNPSMCTRDESYRAQMEADPLEHRVSPARLLVDILAAQVRAGGAARRLQVPALFLTAGQDSISDPAAAERVFASIAAADKRIVKFPSMFHALSVDVGKEKVFAEMLGWVEGRV